MEQKSALQHQVQELRARLARQQQESGDLAAGLARLQSDAVDKLNQIVDELLEENEILRERLRYEQKIQVAGPPVKEKDTAVPAESSSHQQYLLMAAEAAEMGIWFWDLVRDEPFYTDRCKQLLGLAAEAEVTYERIIDSIHPDDRQRVEKTVNRILKTGQTLDIEYRVFWPDGSLHWLHARGRSCVDEAGKPVRLLGTLNDATERKAEQEEMLRRAGVIEMQHHLMHSRELERLKIANDLHEGLLQVMIGIQLSLEDALQIDEKEKRLASMRAVQESLREEVRSLRDYCNELRPPTLMPLGLEKAIRSHSENLKNKHPNLIIEQDLEADRQHLSPELRLALFRIYQELINNVVRHAGATKVSVKLSFSESEVLMEVKDDGRGFELPHDWLEVARQGHLGLVSVQERVEAMHGTLKIITQAGQGTQSLVTVPLPEENRPPSEKRV